MSAAELRILLVDDFQTNRVILRHALLDLGYSRIDEAADGRDALMKIQAAFSESQPYGIVFCDWYMPDLTGIEVLESCRKHSDFTNLPFVMVTAEADQDAVQRAERAHATDYLVKPIDPNRLKSILQKAVPGQAKLG